MQYAERYIQSAEKIIISYYGTIPLHHHLKQFFAADKKYGSKDRKHITHACYCYYRLGKSLQQVSIQEKIKAGIFICEPQPANWETIYDNDWLNNWKTDLNVRIDFLQQQYDFNVVDIFPFADHLSDGIDKNSFITAHLIQPDLFLRIRPNKHNKTYSALSSANVAFHKCGDNCIALPNTTKIDQLLQLNKDVVVQDLSSQRIAEFMSAIKRKATSNSPLQIPDSKLPTPDSKLQTPDSKLPTLSVWDCCAASGGKTILAVDTLKNIHLTVSDVRPSIIQNLKKRFAEAGIRNYHSFVADLTSSLQTPNSKLQTPNSRLQHDLIICDAPCSGSGTWSRTPEQLSFFTEDKISHYTNLQKQIVKNISSAVAVNGYLLYITCSVFAAENEKVVEYIQANSSLKLQRMELLEGYNKKADTMFAALFLQP